MSYCNKCYILVVDDVLNNVLLLQTLLESEGYIVDTSLSGQLALSKIQAAPPDLILLDIVMPGMDGWQVIEHIRQNHDLPFIPILVVTGCDETSIAQGVEESGANGFIRKPINIDKLLQKVSAILGNSGEREIAKPNMCNNLQY